MLVGDGVFVDVPVGTGVGVLMDPWTALTGVLVGVAVGGTGVLVGGTGVRVGVGVFVGVLVGVLGGVSAGGGGAAGATRLLVKVRTTTWPGPGFADWLAPGDTVNPSSPACCSVME